MKLGQIFTKRQVADFMTTLFTIDEDSTIVDPCFGGGVYIDSLLENTRYNVRGIEIDPDLFDAYGNPDANRCSLENGDFFELVDEECDGFIMNPPYVRQEQIGNLDYINTSKLRLQGLCSLTPISTKANLYMYFVLRALSLMKNQGQLVAIIPNSWENTPVGSEFRSNILHFCQISHLYKVEGDAFEGNPVVDVCIMRLVKGAVGQTEYGVVRVTDSGVVQVSSSNERISIDSNNLVRLKSVCCIRRGITTGANDYFVNPPIFDSSHLVQILSSPKTIKGYSTEGCLCDTLFAVPKGATLTYAEKEYIKICEHSIMGKGKPITLKTKVENGEDWYRIRLPEIAELLFSYMVRSNMKFILNLNRLHVRDNFYMIASDKIDKYLLFALLTTIMSICNWNKTAKLMETVC